MSRSGATQQMDAMRDMLAGTRHRAGYRRDGSVDGDR
jgi:hypothetical protein